MYIFLNQLDENYADWDGGWDRGGSEIVLMFLNINTASPVCYTFFT